MESIFCYQYYYTFWFLNFSTSCNALVINMLIIIKKQCRASVKAPVKVALAGRVAKANTVCWILNDHPDYNSGEKVGLIFDLASFVDRMLEVEGAD